MEKNINLIVKSEENDLRVDVFINKKEKLISRTRIKNLILKEKLKLNNEIIKSPSKKYMRVIRYTFKFLSLKKLH